MKNKQHICSTALLPNVMSHAHYLITNSLVNIEYSETCLKRPPMGQYELTIIDRWSLGAVSCVMQPLHNLVSLESE